MVTDILVWCQEEENCVKHWYLQYTALSIDEETLWTDLYIKIQDQYCLLFQDENVVCFPTMFSIMFLNCVNKFIPNSLSPNAGYSGWKGCL